MLYRRLYCSFIKIYFLIFILSVLCVSEWGFVKVCGGGHGGQGRALDAPELKLWWMCVTQWVLENEQFVRRSSKGISLWVRGDILNYYIDNQCSNLTLLKITDFCSLVKFVCVEMGLTHLNLNRSLILW